MRVTYFMIEIGFQNEGCCRICMLSMTLLCLSRPESVIIEACVPTESVRLGMWFITTAGGVIGMPT